MQKLGIHAFVWTGGSTEDDLNFAIDRTRELGFPLIEFPRLDATKFDVARLAARVADAGLKVVVTMGLPFGGDISSEDQAVVKHGERILSDAISVTRDLGGTKLGGIIFSAHGKFQQMPTARGRDNSIAVMRRIAEKAKPLGITVNLEVVNRFETNLLNTTAQGLAYIRDAGMDNIYLHLDTFHMQIEEANPAQAILSAGDRLGYFHVGESSRGYLGAGTIDFDRIFDALIASGYDDYITFESFSSEVVDKDLSIVAGIWRNTWTDNVALARHAKAFIEMRYAEAERRALTARQA